MGRVLEGGWRIGGNTQKIKKSLVSPVFLRAASHCFGLHPAEVAVFIGFAVFPFRLKKKFRLLASLLRKRRGRGTSFADRVGEEGVA